MAINYGTVEIEKDEKMKDIKIKMTIKNYNNSDSMTRTYYVNRDLSFNEDVSKTSTMCSLTHSTHGKILVAIRLLQSILSDGNIWFFFDLGVILTLGLSLIPTILVACICKAIKYSSKKC